LSGGVDSSLVSAIMQQESQKNIKTFSIGFEDKRYDESIYAKEVAKYLNTEHYEYKFKATDVLELINDFDIFYDEPFGDASSLPMMILSKMTKEHVTVALSGDGGDELFTGYERYFLTQDYYKKLSKLPNFARKALSTIAPYSYQDKLEKIAYPLKNLSHENLYAVLNTAVKPWELSKIFNQDFMYSVFDKEPSFLDLQELPMKFNTIENFSTFDFYRYLPDDILTKVDRASMAYSLEARVPLLDHRVVEFAYALPTKVKLQKGKKSILKEILYQHVPKKLIDRPKKGFSVPLQHWFRDELKDILFEKIESLDEKFDKEHITSLANKHIYKNRNYEYIFWNLMRIS
jgi:asparagine synthase (glutamine-hydrolysing)